MICLAKKALISFLLVSLTTCTSQAVPVEILVTIYSYYWIKHDTRLEEFNGNCHLDYHFRHIDERYK